MREKVLLVVVFLLELVVDKPDEQSVSCHIWSTRLSTSN
jgi:hypothetical protein